MYNKKDFQQTDINKILKICAEFPLASVISVDSQQEIFISHLPLIIEQSPTKQLTIIGHASTRNPHLEIFKSNPKVKVVFHGPQTYVNSNWYKSELDVPTWNYCVIEMTGVVEIYHDYPNTLLALQKLTRHMNQSQYHNNTTPWEFYLPDDLYDQKDLMNAIFAFQINISQMNAKFKLGQNRPLVDQKSVATELKKRNILFDAQIAQLMQSQFVDEST